jgi:hypothetical protein
MEIKSIVSNALPHSENLHLVNCFILCIGDYKLECFIISATIQTQKKKISMKLMDSNL